MNEAILIIEDDNTLRTTLQRALKRRGYRTQEAKTPALALELAEATRPDWVVLDLNLDGASGLALIPRLLALNQSCRIVVLTGYASITTAVDAIKLGAVQYLAKPADIDTLLQAFGHTPPESQAANNTASSVVQALPMTVDRVEWEHLQRVLRDHHGNISATARALNMHRRTLQRKLLRLPVKP